ncbi:MAG: sigma-54 factor interaction domain-containing protein [Deltaproteobacteria bacterium]|nr:MAG: sigma-54 factor interaction domain-containing protein [Deltaproteobacteria bacterium]
MEKLQPKNYFADGLMEKNGARLNDRLLIRPIQGRQKAIVLNRKSFKIYSYDKIGVEQVDSTLFLPHGNSDFSFSLNLISREGKDDSFSRYLLKANGPWPFKINGTMSFESFIERGDIIDLSYNRLTVEEEQEVFNPLKTDDKRIIDSGLDIIIEGETGTGKSRLARIIHEKSGRPGDFVPINISAFARGIIESELFGHVKGAFTGAISHKRGAFQEAHNGTLFLDEIDSLSLELQTKLLLFLDSKELRPVGGERSRKVNVRIIYATGRRPKKLMEKGILRQDFYFRISSGASIRLPPLRKNPDYLEYLCQELSLKENKYISPKLIEYYKKYSWPGNIRQLLGHLNKKIKLSKGRKIEHDHYDEELFLHEDFRSQVEDSFLTLEQIKIQYVYKVYLYMGKNYARSAQTLGISANTVKALVGKFKHQ